MRASAEGRIGCRMGCRGAGSHRLARVGERGDVADHVDCDPWLGLAFGLGLGLGFGLGPGLGFGAGFWGWVLGLVLVWVWVWVWG